MATRIYLPSSGAADLTPSTWLFTTQINPVGPFKANTSKQSTTMTSKSEGSSNTSPHFDAFGRHVFGPLAAQSISGTVKGQIRGSESNAGANGSPALGLKLIQPNGTDRSTLLAVTAADSATAGHEFLTTLTNIKFENASEVAAIPITTQSATAGDYLVIEWGIRTATATSRTMVLSYGDDNGTDLPEDTTTTAANNPWIEFSITLTLQGTALAATLSGSGTLAGDLTGNPAVASDLRVRNRRRQSLMKRTWAMHSRRRF